VSGEPAETALNIPPADARARLQRLAYTILSPSLGRRRRTLIAHVAVDRAFSSGADINGVGAPGATYPVLRERVVRRTLTTGRRRAVLANRAPGRPRPTLSAEPELARLLPAARAAYALRHLEGLDRNETHAVLASAGVGDPATATTLADRILTDTRP
jgi:hypothetical protein